MENILIAGCGDVGTALGILLSRHGHVVHGLRRNASVLPGELYPLAADVTDPATLRGLPETDVVFYTAAADGRDDGAYQRAYVRGVNNVMEALARQPRPLMRFFFASSTGVYGQTAGEWVDEFSPTRPARFSGKRLLEGEAACLGSGMAATVVRFGGIYGPGRERLIREVKAGARCVHDPPQFTNRIHRDDCAGMLRHLMGLAAPESVYAGVDCEPAPRCEVLDWLARKLEAPTVERTADRGGGQGKRVSNARLLAAGYVFRYPTYREGYAQLLSDGAAAGARG